MSRSTRSPVAISALLLLLASCGKSPISQRSDSNAAELTRRPSSPMSQEPTRGSDPSLMNADNASMNTSDDSKHPASANEWISYCYPLVSGKSLEHGDTATVRVSIYRSPSIDDPDRENTGSFSFGSEFRFLGVAEFVDNRFIRGDLKTGGSGDFWYFLDEEGDTLPHYFLRSEWSC